GHDDAVGDHPGDPRLRSRGPSAETSMGEAQPKQQARPIPLPGTISDDTDVAASTDISLVIPLHNERPSLKLLVDECRAVLQDPTRDWSALGIEPGTEAPRWEIILVDDGSTDGSFSVLRELAEQ